MRFYYAVTPVPATVGHIGACMDESFGLQERRLTPSTPLPIRYEDPYRGQSYQKWTDTDGDESWNPVPRTWTGSWEQLTQAFSAGNSLILYLAGICTVLELLAIGPIARIVMLAKESCSLDFATASSVSAFL